MSAKKHVSFFCLVAKKQTQINYLSQFSMIESLQNTRNTVKLKSSFMTEWLRRESIGIFYNSESKS